MATELEQNKMELIKKLHKETLDLNGNPKYSIKELEDFKPIKLVYLYFANKKVLIDSDFLIEIVEASYLVDLSKIGEKLEDNEFNELAKRKEEFINDLQNDTISYYGVPTYTIEDLEEKSPVELIKVALEELTGYLGCEDDLVEVVSQAYMVDLDNPEKINLRNDITEEKKVIAQPTTRKFGR